MEALFAFAKLVVDQRDQSVHGFLRLITDGFELDARANASRQHHDTHDAFGVDATLAFADPHFTRKTACEFGELGGRTGMQAQFIADGDRGLRHMFFVFEFAARK